jgi:alcohol dehydrogenase (quinone), cytochrome c subunit
MTNPARRMALALAIGALVCATALTYALWPTHFHVIAASASSSRNRASVERGRYLAVAADCSACHTAEGGRDFAGGRPVASPIGSIYSPNITPDWDAGIGTFSLDQFDRAVRRGIGRTGETLYPAMPYPSYSRMPDNDIADLYSYFLYDVHPVSNNKRSNEIPWPLSIRWPLAIWRKWLAPAADEPSFDTSRYTDPVIARGAYLVQGPGHCGACHTPRGLLYQEKAFGESSLWYLAGGQLIDGWVATNLRGDPVDGLGNWSTEDIVATLRMAHAKEHAVFGAPMGDVVLHSTQYLTDGDLRAIASYLKTLPATRKESSAFAADPATAAALASGRESGRGAELYLDNCNACHRSTGAGSANVFPALAGNSSVLSPDPTSLIILILKGNPIPRTAASPSALGMPGFGWRLSNEEVAQLLAFIRSSWGNQASGISAVQVAHVRAEWSGPPDPVVVDYIPK